MDQRQKVLSLSQNGPITFHLIISLNARKYHRATPVCWKSYSPHRKSYKTGVLLTAAKSVFLSDKKVSHSTRVFLKKEIFLFSNERLNACSSALLTDTSECV